ncbi:2400_t:CDS:2 [Paraglomus occultum]|uniref:2400_t:CDS:1 n=1 Tax=Paraglomus occultum TaxID=144539 RepID=A0A9N9F1H6_9GLOM|nr:2400_t:CDS:2 [Paraglomus occultum]
MLKKWAKPFIAVHDKEENEEALGKKTEMGEQTLRFDRGGSIVQACQEKYIFTNEH